MEFRKWLVSSQERDPPYKIATFGSVAAQA